MSDVLQQRIVPFHGDDLAAVQRPDQTVYVVFNRVCDALGFKRWSQARRIQAHSVLSTGFVTLTIQTEGGPQDAQCLKLDLLPLWLAGVQASKVKEELREKLVHYQTQAAGVLWQAFRGQIVVDDAAIVPSDDDAAIQQLQQIAEMGRAIVRMAEQQIELQRQQTALSGRMDAAARVIRGVQGTLDNVVGQLAEVDVRIGVLEDRLQPAAYITDAQATEVSNRVKTLGQLLSQTQPGKNHYQGIFAELYRRFGVSSYKLIRQEQYAGVLAFLEEWRQANE
jgi:hypothetical protein